MCLHGVGWWELKQLEDEEFERTMTKEVEEVEEVVLALSLCGCVRINDYLGHRMRLCGQRCSEVFSVGGLGLIWLSVNLSRLNDQRLGFLSLSFDLSILLACRLSSSARVSVSSVHITVSLCGCCHCVA